MWRKKEGTGVESVCRKASVASSASNLKRTATDSPSSVSHNTSYSNMGLAVLAWAGYYDQGDARS